MNKKFSEGVPSAATNSGQPTGGIESSVKLYSYIAFFAFGAFAMILPSALPKVMETFSINYAQSGYLLILGTSGYVAGSVICALFAHVMGLRRIAILGSLTATVGVFLFAFGTHYTFLLFANFFANIGMGLIETVVGALAGGESDKKVTSLLNKINASFALGSLLSPFVVSALLRFGIGWQMAYIIIGILTVISFFVAVFIRESTKIEHEAVEEAGLPPVKKIFKPVYLMIYILIGVYVGYEVGFSSWITTFMTNMRGIAVTVAAASSSAFWLGMVIGRYGASYVKLRDEVWLFSIVASSLVSVLVTMFVSNYIGLILFIFLAGLSFASSYPTIQVMLIKRAKKNVGNLMGVFVFFVGIGASISQWLIGTVANDGGIFMGFGVLPIFISIELVLAFTMMKREKRQKTTLR